MGTNKMSEETDRNFSPHDQSLKGEFAKVIILEISSKIERVASQRLVALTSHSRALEKELEKPFISCPALPNLRLPDLIALQSAPAWCPLRHPAPILRFRRKSQLT